MTAGFLWKNKPHLFTSTVLNMIAVFNVWDCLQYIVLDRHFMWEHKNDWLEKWQITSYKWLSITYSVILAKLLKEIKYVFLWNLKKLFQMSHLEKIIFMEITLSTISVQWIIDWVDCERSLLTFPVMMCTQEFWTPNIILTPLATSYQWHKRTVDHNAGFRVECKIQREIKSS